MIDPVTQLPGEGRRKVATRGAMVADLIKRVQKIAIDGDDATVLRLLGLAHEVMQPVKGEPLVREPRRVVFRDVPSGLDQKKAEPAPPPPDPDAPVFTDPEGNPYVQP